MAVAESTSARRDTTDCAAIAEALLSWYATQWRDRHWLSPGETSEYGVTNKIPARVSWPETISSV